ATFVHGDGPSKRPASRNVHNTVCERAGRGECPSNDEWKILLILISHRRGTAAMQPYD
ncbi:14121_t:CDS:2, partial [Acaulospora colombiana]